MLHVRVCQTLISLYIFHSRFSSLEIERAKLTKILSDIKEKDGDISGAASILQEVQVETFGSMDKKEKIDYILEQMRLCLLKKDYIRASIIAKKIDPKHLLDEVSVEGLYLSITISCVGWMYSSIVFCVSFQDIQELKLKYYALMTEFHTYNNDTLALSKCAEAVFNTEIVKADVNRMQVSWCTTLRAFTFMQLTGSIYRVGCSLHVYTLPRSLRIQ